MVWNHRLAARGVPRCGVGMSVLRRSFLRIWSVVFVVKPIDSAPGVVAGVVRSAGAWYWVPGAEVVVLSPVAVVAALSLLAVLSSGCSGLGCRVARAVAVLSCVVFGA